MLNSKHRIKSKLEIRTGFSNQDESWFSSPPELGGENRSSPGLYKSSNNQWRDIARPAIETVASVVESAFGICDLTQNPSSRKSSIHFSSDLSESPPFSRDVNSATCVEGITIEYSGNHSCDPRNNQFAFDKSFSGGMPSSSPSCINCSADTSLVTFYPLTITNLLHAPTCTEMSMSDAIFSNYSDSSIDETNQSEAHSNSEFLNTEGYSNE